MYTPELREKFLKVIADLQTAIENNEAPDKAISDLVWLMLKCNGDINEAGRDSGDD